MISPRFGPAVLLIAVFALIPTVIHSYRGLTIDDGLTVRSIPETLAGMPSTPTARKDRWVESNLSSRDWFERTYRVGRSDVRLFAARSFDAKKLYHHPELAVLRGLEPESSGKTVLPGRPDIPIEVLTTSDRGRRGIAVYALSYRGDYIDNPILFQLKMSRGLVFRGRRAMTLFMASDLAGSPRQLDKAPAVTVLRAALEAFESAAAGQASVR